MRYDIGWKGRVVGVLDSMAKMANRSNSYTLTSVTIKYCAIEIKSILMSTGNCSGKIVQGDEWSEEKRSSVVSSIVREMLDYANKNVFIATNQALEWSMRMRQVLICDEKFLQRYGHSIVHGYGNAVT